MTPIIPRRRATQDAHRAVDFYLDEAGPEVAIGFITSLKKAYAHIGSHSETGSPRYAHELDLPGLRMWRLKRFPYLVFYMIRDDHIDVWRVLHDGRDQRDGLIEPGQCRTATRP